MKLYILFFLFVALSPGIILLLPSLSAREGVERGISYQNTNSVDSCVSVGEWIPDKTPCDKAKSIFFSNQTTSFACLIHGLLFYIALKLFFNLKYKFEIAVLFILLCPGLLITLPNLSRSDCASVAENNNFCKANDLPVYSACKTCTNIIFSKSTNIKPVIVHALLFIFICNILIQQK